MYVLLSHPSNSSAAVGIKIKRADRALRSFAELCCERQWAACRHSFSVSGLRPFDGDTPDHSSH